MVCPACNTHYDGGQFCARDGTPLVRDQGAPRTDLVGQVIAERYRIVKLLGEGGMGQVYEAQHVNINKRFAIKLLRPEIVSNPEAVARFRQEAWSASSIGHENIIEIDDFATLPSGSVYLAMEFLQGMSLAERMRDGIPIPLGEALDLFSQVARGLQAAHEKGIIHRDMKPENIFLAERHGRMIVKILDFGIAKVSGTDGQQSLTRTGAIFGTPHYMSPEQALGKSLDFRTDLYSVGVIMYEVFTGRVPFEAESFMGILTKHITSEPKRPSEVAPDRQIPPEVEAIILKAMAKEPGDRYGSMKDLEKALIAAMQVWAPHLLSPSGLIPISARAPTPSQPIHVAGATSSRVVAQAGPVPQPTGFEIAAAPIPKPSSRGGSLKWLFLGALLLGGGGAAAFLLARSPEAAPIPASTPAAAPTTPATAAPVKAAVPQPAAPAVPAAPALERVIVDSLPPGAKILLDGKVHGETPDEIKVQKGATVDVVLHKDGYVDEPVTVDPSKGRKLLVKLDREHVRAHGHPKPHPAVAHHPPPARPPATAPTVHRRPADPYERLDDNPPPSNSKRNDNGVLNPY